VIAKAQPKTELRPQSKNPEENIDQEMDMTYEELDQYGKILILNRSGPVSMFEHLLIKWCNK